MKKLTHIALTTMLCITIPVVNFGQTAPDLKTSADYAVLAATGISFAEGTSYSYINNLDIGLYPGVLSSITGQENLITNGVILAADADPDNLLLQAKSDLEEAYLFAEGSTDPAPATISGNQGGETLAPGIWKSTSTLSIDGTPLTLDADGDENAVWIFQIASGLTTTTGGNVVLAGGAKANNVYWQVGSSATIGNYTDFKGNIMAFVSISMDPFATIDGRLLALTGAVTFAGDNTINKPEESSMCEDALISYFPTAQNVCEGLPYSIDFNNVEVENAIEENWEVDPLAAGEIVNGIFTLDTEYVGQVTITLTAVAETPCLDAQESLSFTVVPMIPINCPPEMNVLFTDGPVTLTGGTPEGGIYSGTGVAGTTFDPAIAGPGTHEITYTIDDICGEQSCEFTITVTGESFIECVNDQVAEPNTLPCSYIHIGTNWDAVTVDNCVTNLILSTFDLDEEGWTRHVPHDESATISWFATGGNPGGYIRFNEPGQGTVDRFAAPALFLGNKSGFYGGTLSYDMRISDIANITIEDRVILGGSGLSLYYTTPYPTTTWQTFEVPLVEGGWKVDGSNVIASEAQLRDVLGNLQSFTILADWIIGSEQVDLDNVLMTPGPSYYVLSGATEGTGYSLNGVEFNQGETTVTWYFTDSCGNMETCSFTVTVLPVTIPVCPSSFSVLITDAPFALSDATPEGGTYSGNGVSGDIFDPDEAGIGTHTITYTIEDNNCGPQSCDFSIIVSQESVPPIPISNWALFLVFGLISISIIVIFYRRLT